MAIYVPSSPTGYPGNVKVPESPIGYPGSLPNIPDPAPAGGAIGAGIGATIKDDNKLTYDRTNVNIGFGGTNYATFKGSDGNYYIAKIVQGRNNSTIKWDTLQNIDDLPTLYTSNKEYTKDQLKKLIDEDNPLSMLLYDTAPKKEDKPAKANKPVSNKPTTIDITTTPEYKQLLADRDADRALAKEQGEKIDALLAEIDKLKNPPSAQEMAKHYGIDLDQDLFLSERNAATNKFYDDATTYQNRLRNQYVSNTAGQYDNVYNKYLDTYQNAAPTASGKGVRAASVLSDALQGQQYMQNVDQGMLQSVNDLEAARKKELENNPNLAAQQYSDLAAYLTSAGTQKHVSDVKGYAQALKAASDMTLSNRNLASQFAQNAATRYQGLANAAGTNAHAQAQSNNLWDQMYTFFLNIYGNSKDASSAIMNYANVSNNN